MKQICFVTGNKNKLQEIQQLLFSFKIISLHDLNFFDDIPETENTIEGNAFLKANFINNKFNIDCFSDDTGLFIDSLDGLPGVKSARFAGENSNSEENISLVLKSLENKKSRSATFKTVICLIINNRKHFFEGSVPGTITEQKSGESGFGYDPIFIPFGYNKTFSEMTIEEKNLISHRSKAVQKLIKFLNSYEK
ncbi:MAG: non-canonical purine NTP pyrophosphatase, RdgB/HAM1 family [Flammeovirgaceae bacterium]|nr:non-canonical purine NTP pyrophosphatase, RdgB/HAM1 family [Flammeovirgaceae bacterium]|tara:strand:+ start:197 stop:778 length:582 start_codon:yes stop_codon:yes gene_type:complete